MSTTVHFARTTLMHPLAADTAHAAATRRTHLLPYIARTVLLACVALGTTTGLAQTTAPAEMPIPEAQAIPTIAWKDAALLIGRQAYVVGRIERTGKARSGHVFLNFSEQRGSATIFIRKENVHNFAQPPETFYRGKMIRVKGFITEFKGAPEIAIAGPDAIDILPDDTPLPPTPELPAPTSRPAVGDTITIASYNVLNLFDPVDDPYTNDQTTAPKPRHELRGVAQVIRELSADVVGLVEVENRGYLQQFVDVYLPDMGYEVVLYEGNDLRGIDVAVLSRLPVGPVTSYRHVTFPDGEGSPMRYQRDLLRVQIEPPGAPAFDVFVVHLKSKGGEENGGLRLRLGEARHIRRTADEILAREPDRRFVILGDFNDTIDSEPVQTILGTGTSSLITFVPELPPGETVTYNQPPHLSMIDFIIASPAMARAYVPGSYRILLGGSPEKTGSDHNPVVARFKLR